MSRDVLIEPIWDDDDTAEDFHHEVHHGEGYGVHEDAHHPYVGHHPYHYGDEHHEPHTEYHHPHYHEGHDVFGLGGEHSHVEMQYETIEPVVHVEETTQVIDEGPVVHEYEHY